MTENEIGVAEISFMEDYREQNIIIIRAMKSIVIEPYKSLRLIVPKELMKDFIADIFMEDAVSNKFTALSDIILSEESKNSIEGENLRKLISLTSDICDGKL